jgi:thiol-disulfide isomerase/thioredoxin
VVAVPASYVLHLLSGDTIPCTAVRIDESGVTYKSTVSDATFIPHEQLKVLELAPRISAGQIAKSKKERLLTLPRMQRDSPPTQLLRSLDGDYLRGRVVSMDDKEIHVEVRLETRVIPRNQVARLIWLHADEMEGATPALSPSDSNTGTRVQSLPADGNRLTFFAEQLDGLMLTGKSPLLGVCRIDLLQVDQLVLGPAIEQTASSLAFHQWKLRNAPDPLEAPEDGGSGSEGLESVLVGKPAPEFELDLLSGEKFRLGNEKGKIIVLDFWASWCGPCLQAMPQVDRVATEYADRDVKLVAVNLEETPERVKAALERLKLETTVALDRNGRIAEKYGATAIPQTVIIDREGVVARLFVGGGARFDDQLRAALDSVLSGAPSKSE